MTSDRPAPSFNIGMSAVLRAAIGELVVEFQSLELNMTSVAVLLLPVPQRIGQVITAELSFRRRADLMMAIFWELHGPGTGLAELEALVSTALKCENERNTILHSAWTFGHRSKTTATKGRIRFQGEQHVDDTQLLAAARICNATAHAFFNLYIKLCDSGRDGLSIMHDQLAARGTDDARRAFLGRPGPTFQPRS